MARRVARRPATGMPAPRPAAVIGPVPPARMLARRLPRAALLVAASTLLAAGAVAGHAIRAGRRWDPGRRA